MIIRRHGGYRRQWREREWQLTARRARWRLLESECFECGSSDLQTGRNFFRKVDSGKAECRCATTRDAGASTV